MFDHHMFNAKMLPEEERETASAILTNLFALEWIVNQFEAALKLYDFTDTETILANDPRAKKFERPLARVDHNRLMAAWARMAARSGAMTIYELYQMGQVIDKLTANCPSLSQMVDSDARKRSTKLFKTSFPSFAPVRNFAAHGSEMTAHPEDVELHAATDLDIPGLRVENGASVMVSGALFGRRFTSTYEGREVAYELTQQTLAILREVVSARLASFVPASRITHEKGLEEWKERHQQPPEG